MRKMNELTPVRDRVNGHKQREHSGGAELRAAEVLFERQRAQGLAELNQLFRSGKVPDPAPNGRYAGKLNALDIAPGLTQFFQWLTEAWMPWLGKTFNADQQVGDNIFAKDSYPLARFFNPFYRGFVNDGPQTYRAFAFRTYVAPGLADPDRMVLKIDYDIPGNPSLNVRRVLDELVQIDENLYLGKAHVRWWWGSWQMVAYFSLTRNMESGSLLP
jgi:hypothetical protein